jgi:hypothetical protein
VKFINKLLRSFLNKIASFSSLKYLDLIKLKYDDIVQKLAELNTNKELVEGYYENVLLEKSAIEKNRMF